MKSIIRRALLVCISFASTDFLTDILTMQCVTEETSAFLHETSRFWTLFLEEIGPAILVNHKPDLTLLSPNCSNISIVDCRLMEDKLSIEEATR